MKVKFILIVVFVIFNSITPSWALKWETSALDELVGSRTTTLDGGLIAAPKDGTWQNGGFSISWAISSIMAGSLSLWEYEYNIAVPVSNDGQDNGALSSWVLEFTEDQNDINFYDSTGGLLSGLPDGFTEGPDDYEKIGNKKIPNDLSIYGFKLNSSKNVSFITDRDPVYGVAAWKDGSIGAFAYTAALEYPDFKTTDLSPDYFIVRPDGGQVPVPEPATVVAFFFGILGVFSIVIKLDVLKFLYNLPKLAKT